MNEFELLSEIAKLYYEQDMTQQDIARRLYMSRSSVSRMLKQAKDTGVVEILIHDPYDRLRIMEYEFSKRFDVEEIRIVNTGDKSNPIDFKAVTRLAAVHLNSLLKDDSVLGLMWGKSVYATLHELRVSRSLSNMHVVQMAGSIKNNDPVIDGPDLVRYVADLYKCNYHYLVVPFSVEDMKIRNSLIKHPAIIETLSMIDYVNIMCTGIGSSQNWSRNLKEKEILELDNAKAVGSISGYFFDINGRIIDLPDFYNRIICVSKERLLKIPFRLGVAVDPQKSKAILGALRGKLINSLITCSYTAERILKLDDNNEI